MPDCYPPLSNKVNINEHHHFCADWHAHTQDLALVMALCPLRADNASTIAGH